MRNVGHAGEVGFYVGYIFYKRIMIKIGEVQCLILNSIFEYMEDI